MAYDEETLRARFWELKARKEALEAQARPLRDKYDKLRKKEAELQEQQKVISDQFQEIEAPCFEMAQEMAALVRALKGKTGPAPASKA